MWRRAVSGCSRSIRKPIGSISMWMLHQNWSDASVFCSEKTSFVAMPSPCFSRMITQNSEWIDEYKVMIAKAYGERGDFPYLMLGKPFVAEKGSCCTETYLVIGPFGNRKICENVISYIRTKFFRFLVLQKKNTQNAYKRVTLLSPSKTSQSRGRTRNYTRNTG